MNAFHATAMVIGAGNLCVHIVLWAAIGVLGGSVNGPGGAMHPVPFAVAVISGAPTGDLRAIGVPYLPNVAFLGGVKALSPSPKPNQPPTRRGCRRLRARLRRTCCRTHRCRRTPPNRGTTITTTTTERSF